MVKLTKVSAVAVLLLVAFAPFSFAAVGNPQVVNVSASVPANVSLTINIFAGDAQGNPAGQAVGAMAFGNLQASGFVPNPNPGNQPPSTNLVSKLGQGSVGSFVVFLTPNTQGDDYFLRQTGTALALQGNPGITIPAGACRMTPVYNNGDNGGQGIPNGGALGNAASWVGNNVLIYQSEATPAQSRTVQAHYSITESQNGTVPADQQAGNYAGTITFTMTV
jgi:hypothetical protein